MMYIPWVDGAKILLKDGFSVITGTVRVSYKWGVSQHGSKTNQKQNQFTPSEFPKIQKVVDCELKDVSLAKKG